MILTTFQWVTIILVPFFSFGISALFIINYIKRLNNSLKISINNLEGRQDLKRDDLYNHIKDCIDTLYDIHDKTSLSVRLKLNSLIKRRTEEAVKQFEFRKHIDNCIGAYMSESIDTQKQLECLSTDINQSATRLEEGIFRELFNISRRLQLDKYYTKSMAISDIEGLYSFCKTFSKSKEEAKP